MATEHDWKSPYFKTPAFGRFLGYYVHRPIAAHYQDSAYKIPHQWVRRPDLVALDLYGDADLWMVVPLRNGFEDPVYDLTLGRTIIVPTFEHARESLGG